MDRLHLGLPLDKRNRHVLSVPTPRLDLCSRFWRLGSRLFHTLAHLPLRLSYRQLRIGSIPTRNPNTPCGLMDTFRAPFAGSCRVDCQQASSGLHSAFGKVPPDSVGL
ncbi:hypothetical protein CGCTS75_v004841 [Colletotrichum tropicale]|nr:hypothetical protein CGCTS75_v004841 [Colletotrichum tropicale]